MNLISLFVTSLLTENIILTKFLGLCPFFGTSKKSSNALTLGLCLTFVLTLSAIISYFAYYYILVPYNITYLRTICFILIIAIMVELVEILLKKINSSLNEKLGIYLPLLASNCAILGVCLININKDFTFLETIIYSLGSSIGYTLVIYLFSTIRERLDKADISKNLKGYPISFITAGIMVLILSRYVGV